MALSHLIALPPPRTSADRLRAALQLHDDAVALERQRLHRPHPLATSAELDELVRRWLQDQPPPLDGVPGFRRADHRFR